MKWHNPLVACYRSVGVAPIYEKYFIIVHILLYTGGGRDENYDRKLDREYWKVEKRCVKECNFCAYDFQTFVEAFIIGKL